MLKGRLGLSTARVPHSDRHGLLWLSRGNLTVEDGSLIFTTAGTAALQAGVYQIPFQGVSNLLMGPGSTISHDSFRLLSRHGTGVVFVGDGAVRCYASMPFGPDDSKLARKQAALWVSQSQRIDVARRMYAMRMGELPPQTDLNALRGIEGHRMKAIYKGLAKKYGVSWSGRSYDRAEPDADNLTNKAINHTSSAVRAAGMVAVALTGTIPQLGFIHEASGNAFALDIADLFRASVTLPAAFQAVKRCEADPHLDVERTARKLTAEVMWKEDLVPKMIDAIKELIDVDDADHDPQRP